MRIRGLLIFLLSFPFVCFAQEKSSMEDRIIGSTFKALAKALTVTVDVNKLKEANINKLAGMEEEKFKKRYAKVYAAIKELPPGLKVRYGITEQMTKERVIEDIKSLDKKNINEAIDSIPDRVIAKQFKQYISEKRQLLANSDVVGQINECWNKIMSKVYSSGRRSPLKPPEY